MVRYLITRFLAVLTGLLLAAPIALGQAGAAMDQKAWDLMAGMGNGPVYSRFDRVTKIGESTVYERFSPPAFVILSSFRDQLLVAGYSRDNLFYSADSVSSVPESLLNSLSAPATAALSRHKGVRTFSDPVGPLLRTQWGQGRFFNYYCPRDPGGPNGRALPGCVAVALGQIVRYYGDFNQANLDHSWISGKYGQVTAHIGSYNWNRMENTLVAVNREVCDLLADMAVLVHTTYGTTSSSANSHRTLQALQEMGFNQATRMNRSNFTADSWADLLYANISEYKPILVTGGGHAFVCDGYDEDGLLHFNLGGAGYGDGYYLPGLLVLDFPVSEAFVDLEPVTWPSPPPNIRLLKSVQKQQVAWSPGRTDGLVEYRIYLDGQTFTSTRDTAIIVDQIPPGIHTIHVSTVVPDGESRWIGPVELFIRGPVLTVQDPSLYSAFMAALGYGKAGLPNPEVYQGDLSRLISLEIDQPILSLEGIGLCTSLRKLSISGFPGLALDAGPLGNLIHLQVLEWKEQLAGNTAVIGTLSNLSELRFIGSRLEEWDFLRNLDGLMKLTYSGAPAPDPSILTALTSLDELDLSGAGLKQAVFLSSMTGLMSLRLADNQLTESPNLEKMSLLARLDLSGNCLTSLILTDQLQSLTDLDLHNNLIDRISASADLAALKRINLSGNRLEVPGRLFLYTPALEELDLSGNRLRGMGNYRSPALQKLNVSNNLLIATEWAELHPRLRQLDLSNNRISDLSGLLTSEMYRQYDYLTVSGNPVSKESFEDHVPLLKEGVRNFEYPGQYQPLSPCYPTPARGSRFAGSAIELSWVSDQNSGECVFDLYRSVGDSLVLMRKGLDVNRMRLEDRPAGPFMWVVAARTADTTYYSGIYEAFPSSTWALPFTESFETYTGYEPIAGQSDSWIVTGQIPGNSMAMVVTSVVKSGFQCLELSGTAVGSLSMEHLKMPEVTLRFSVWAPSGRKGSVRIVNLAGMEIRIEYDSRGSGRAWVNDKPTGTFPIAANTWTDFRLTAHGRNNQVFMWAGGKLIINQPWLFPSGSVDMARLEFNPSSGTDTDPAERLMFVDDISVNVSGYTGLDDKPALTADPLVTPNPFKNHIFITLPETGRYHLSIIDISGREVLSQFMEAITGTPVQLTTESLPDGIFILRITGRSGNTSLRLVKNLSGY
ncbi:MAG: hypothetical protein A2X22_00445 [Bacteroidetes bacterium GWF2_49_14]|nr:MAG: hypothetical protein A2X22_00445 [Bacteroidetes bacterium GWF2_49_14]